LHPFSFRDLNLRQAEEALVAGCLDHTYALVTAARELGVHPFRSECAFELDKYYVSLINMYISGCYNELGNREALALAYPEDAFRVEDDLFDGNTAVDEYVDALVAALRETYDAQDEAVRAAMALTETAIYLKPGSPPTAPRPLRRPKPPDKGGSMRGLEL
jgi:hypothetical protein